LGSSFIIAYFCYLAWPALFNGFNVDDPMNMWQYWRLGWGDLIRGAVLFFTTEYRPVGGLFYKILYGLFGFNPLPFHVAITALMLLNTYLGWRLGKLLSGSALTGGLCALAVAYHPRMPHLLYLPAFVYDVLCFTFYFLALNTYLAARRSGAQVTRGRFAAFVVLYAAALGSKEMAVTLPFAMLLYELLWHAPGGFRRDAIIRWLRNAMPVWVAGLMTVVYIVGKSVGADALSQLPGYRPILTWSHVMGEQTSYLNEILYAPFEAPFFTISRTLLLWAAMVAVAVISENRVLRWASVFVIVAPLPVAVLPGRGAACLYIPLAGWALYAAALLVELCRRASGLPLLRLRPTLSAALLCAIGVAAFVRLTLRHNVGMPRYMAEPTKLTMHVAHEVRRVLPRPKPGASAIFLTDVSESFDTHFIAELVWGDPSVHVLLQHFSKLAPAEIESLDYVFEFSPDGKLRMLKP
jgi:hypothetical protein